MTLPTPTTVLCIIAVGLGSSFQFGFNTGVINVPQLVIQEWMNSTVGASHSHLDTAWSGIVAVWCVGGFLGCHAASLMSDRLGRRAALLIASVPAAISSIMFFCSKASNWYPILIIARFLNGISCGIHTTIAPVYLMKITPKGIRGAIGGIHLLFITMGIALSSTIGIHTTIAPVYLMEISPKGIRGAIGGIHQLFITVGIALSSTIGLPTALGSERLWPILLGLTGVPVVLQLLLLPWCPDTPKFLYLHKKDEQLALNALRRLRTDQELEAELRDLSDQKKSEETRPSQVAWVSFVLQPVLLKPLLICTVMMMCNQLSGFTVALYYSTRTLKTAGLSDETAKLTTMGFDWFFVAATMLFLPLVDIALYYSTRTLKIAGLSDETAKLTTVGFEWFFVAATMLFLPLVDRVGRRPLMLVGIGAMLVLNVLLAVFLSFQAQWISYVAVVLIVCFMLFTALGPGSIPWFYTSEVFLQSARVRANSIAAAINWTLNFLVGLTFLPIQNEIHQYTFLIFAVILLGCWLVLFFFTPETKGRSVEEIVADFSGSILY